MFDFSSSNNNINSSNNPFNNFDMLNNKNLSKSVNQNTFNATLQNNQFTNFNLGKTNSNNQ